MLSVRVKHKLWCALQEVMFIVQNEGGAGQFWLSATEQDADSYVQVQITCAHCFSSASSQITDAAQKSFNRAADLVCSACNL